MIASSDVDRYRERGYIVVESVLRPEEIDALRREVDSLVDKARSLTEHDEVYDLEDSHTREQPRVRRIKLPHKRSPVFAELTRHRGMLEIAARLIGPDIRLHTSKLNIKAAGYGAAVEWHQDWAFYPHSNDDILAVGVMIDDMAADNGPLMVLPGSHQGPVHSHFNTEGYFCGAIDPVTSGLDFSKAERITAPAGSMSFHHVRAVHGSALNDSGRGRRLLLYELTAADAWPLAGSFSKFTDLAEYDSRLLTGRPTTKPRLTVVPVRIPQPRSPDLASIYQAQKGSDHHYFQSLSEAKAAEEVH